MALPTITIDNVNGSNTAASGAGPATALFGTAAATAASTVITLSVDNPDLSGVAVDGSAVIWIQSSSGRMFSKITATDNTLKTVTVANAYANTESGKLWGIGGRRKDFETTNSNTKLLFSADALPGWTIDILNQSSNYVLTSTITINVSGDTTTGEIKIISSSTTQPTITTATNSTPLFSVNNGAGFIRFRNLKGTNTAGTRAGMFTGTGTAGQNNCKIVSCWCDGCSYLFDGTGRTCAGLSVVSTYATNCTSGVIANGSGVGGTNPADLIDSCFFYNNAGAVYNAQNNAFDLNIVNSVFAKNGRALTDGNAGSSRAARVTIRNSTIAGSTTEGITNANAAGTWFLTLLNTIIYGNAGFGVDLLNTAAANDARSGAVNYNFIGSNTSGNYNNLTAGLNDVALTADPFTNSAGGDYSLNNNAGGGAAIRAAGYPGAFVGGLTTGYLDGGAAQHQDSGGGGTFGGWESFGYPIPSRPAMIPGG